jgi:hypothetical protein
MEPLPTFANLSENEKIIRTYRCTSLKQLFHKPAVGYLSVTNKRLVYHSENKRLGSESAVISEIPLQMWAASVRSSGAQSTSFISYC